MEICELCRKVPPGKVTTYGELARAAGTSPRAVGAKMKQNSDTDVPCHRVVMSDGSLGGYNQGVREKIRRLEGEGVKVVDGKIDLSEFFIPLQFSLPVASASPSLSRTGGSRPS